MTDTKTELMPPLPCPFCKSESVKLRSDFNKENRGCQTALVHCFSCGADGPGVDSCHGGTEALAIELWNSATRPDHKGLLGAVVGQICGSCLATFKKENHCPNGCK